jgi:hypothetical protein
MPEFRRLKKAALTAFACFKRKSTKYQTPLPVPAFNGAVRQRLHIENREEKQFSGRSIFRVPVCFISSLTLPVSL